MAAEIAVVVEALAVGAAAGGEVAAVEADLAVLVDLAAAKARLTLANAPN